MNVPANQTALASVLPILTRRQLKLHGYRLETAGEVMSRLRKSGFRIVPFPPLKSRRGKSKRRTK